jgi:DNA-binding SARP family transcriptional activator
MDRAIKCNSPIHKRLAALLVGQALSDLEEFQESFEHLTSWIDKWEKSGLRTLAIAGALEISSLLLKKGKMEEARKYYVQASNLLPKGENILNLYRPIEFLEKLKRSLHPDSVEVEDLLSEAEAPVRIQTFGELRVQIGDQILYDRKWRGGRTKALLKALIIYGGEKVSKDLLIDALWPDADGDLAMTNLKVALSRLRRVGCEKGQEPLPWIVVRHRHISLVKSLCFVDSIQFKSTLFAALKDRENEELLFKALDLYKNDFLVNDASEMWIIKHREVLREEFIKGVMVLSERCLEIEKLEEALPYLNKAVEKDPLHEGLYANLMKTYLKMGYPSRALKIFRQAKEIFQQELGIEPNSPLLALAQEASGKK